MREILNASATNVGIAVGLKTGLFDALAAGGSASSVADLALRTRFEDKCVCCGRACASPPTLTRLLRYIEEWLGLMVAGGIVTVPTAAASATGGGEATDAGGPAGAGSSAGAGAAGSPGIAAPVRKYALAPGAATVLATRDGRHSELALRSQQLQTLVTEGYDHMAECFAQGAGVPRGLLNDSSRIAAQLRCGVPINEIVSQVPSLHDTLTRGGASASVCVAGDSHASFGVALGRAYPTAAVSVWCEHPDDVEEAKAAIAKAGVTNVVAEGGSVDWGVNEGEGGKYSWLVALQGLGASNDPTCALENVSQSLAPGGHVSLLQLLAGPTPEETCALQPLAQVEYAASLLHALPLARSGDSAGVGLLWDNAEVQAAMASSGFDRVRAHAAPWDASIVHFVGQRNATPAPAPATATATAAAAVHADEAAA